MMNLKATPRALGGRMRHLLEELEGVISFFVVRGLDGTTNPSRTFSIENATGDRGSATVLQRRVVGPRADVEGGNAEEQAVELMGR